MSTDDVREVRTEYREAFWALAAGVPVVLSVLRLWVESGGELQITLLLAANMGTLNLVAALFVTSTQMVTMMLVALLTAGGILRAAVDAAPAGSRLRSHVPVVVKVTNAAPLWFSLAVFALAIPTWKILYLPLLIPAAVAVLQRPPWTIHDRLPVAIGSCLALLAVYGWLIAPAVVQAWADGEAIVVILLAFPPLVAFGVAGPLPAGFARVFAPAAQLAIIGLLLSSVQVAVQTPILPLVVTEATVDGTEPEFIRGHIISVDDANLTLLEEQGGVRYIPTVDVKSTVLCGTPADIPAFHARVRGIHVEDSLLTAIGRRVRPHVRVDPLCRIAASQTGG